MTKELADEPDRSVVHGGTFFDAPSTLEKLAREQGVKPFNFDELLDMNVEERWPDDENVDDFITAVREWRTEGKDRTLP